MGRVLESLKQELKSFTGVWVYTFVLEDFGQHLFAQVQVAAVFVLLDENLAVEDNFNFTEGLCDIRPFFLLECPILNNPVAVLYQSELQLADWTL